jgi:hypothetical protein
MRKTIFGASVMAVFAVSGLAALAPATANPAQDKVISGYCDNHTDASDCNDWRYNRGSWTDAQYQAFYLSHRGETEFSGNEASAAFVSGSGALPPPDPNATATEQRVTPGYTESSKIMTNTPGPVESTTTGDVVKTVPEVQGDSPTHVADCQATFKSYDAATDTYMGSDGSREKCKL